MHVGSRELLIGHSRVPCSAANASWPAWPTRPKPRPPPRAEPRDSPGSSGRGWRLPARGVQGGRAGPGDRAHLHLPVRDVHQHRAVGDPAA